MARPVRQIIADDPIVAEHPQARSDQRGSAGLTLRQVAERAHYSVSALSEATSGRRMPTWELTRSFVEACGGDLDEWRKRWKYAAEQYYQLEEPDSQPAEPDDPARLPPIRPAQGGQGSDGAPSPKALGRAGRRSRALIAAGLVSLTLLIALISFGLYIGGQKAAAPAGFTPTANSTTAASRPAAARATTPWYASVPFATSVSAAVALAGVLSTWAMVRWSGPRRELIYRVVDVVPVPMPMPMRQSSDPKSRRPGSAHIVQLQLANRGRHDIPSSAFDQDRPLILDVAAPILAVLKIGSGPTRYDGPPVHAEGTGIALRPALIKRGQKITISLLVHGANPCVAIEHSPLIDTRIREYKGSGRRVEYKVMLTVAAVGAIALTTLVAAITSTAEQITTVASVASTLIAAGVAWTMISADARSRRAD